MAEKPVLVPVELQVTELNMTALDTGALKDVEKQLSKAVKSISDVFGQIDASKINKPIEAALTKVQAGLSKVLQAQDNYRQAMVAAGQSSENYKADVMELAAAEQRLSEQENVLADLRKSTSKGPTQQTYIKEAEKALAATKERVQELRELTSSPEMYADDGAPEKIAKIKTAYTKVQTAIADLNRSQQQFNTTVDKNKLSEEYTEQSDKAEKLKAKLEQLNEKSKKMAEVGATDKAWESLQYDAKQVSSELDSTLRTMRKMVKEGNAFRFDAAEEDVKKLQAGIKSINSTRMGIAGNGKNRVGSIAARANANMSPYTADYQKQLSELQKLESQATKLTEKYERMKALGKATPEGLKAAAYDAQQLNGKLEESRQKLTGMVNAGQAFRLGKGDTSAEISGINSRIDDTKNKLSTISSKFSGVRGVLGKIATTSKQIGQVLGKGLAAAARGAASLAKGLTRVVRGLANVIRNGISAVRNMKLFGKSGGKSTTDLAKGFKKLRKNMLMYVFGFRSAYYAIKRLRTIFINAFKTMATQYDEINQQLSSFVMALNRLKGSLGTMFQPIISVLIPVLNVLMDKLANAMELMGKFFATLTGQDFIYKATANTYDLAESLDAAGSAAEETEKKLGAYDKLDVIQDNNDDKNKGNSNGNLLDVTYGKAAIEGAASEFAKLIKESWENQDFTEVGEVITRKIVTLLTNIRSKILPKITNFINRITRSAVTFFEGFDLKQVGSNIAQAINDLLTGIDFTALGQTLASLKSAFWQFLYGLLTDLDWEGVGVSIANFVMGWVDKIDIDAILGAIRALINGVGSALITFVDNVDWAEVGNKFGDGVQKFIEDVDLGKIAKGVGKLVRGIGTSLLNFVQKIDFQEIATSVADGINTFFGEIDGSDFSSGLGSLVGGIVTFLGTLIAEIDWSAIYKTLVNGIQNLLSNVEQSLKKSNSPTLQSIGDLVGAIRQVIESLAPVIEKLIAAIGPIVDAILPILTDLLPPIADILAQAVDMVLPLLTGLIETMLPFFKEIVDAILPIIQEVLTALQPVFETLTTTILPIMQELLAAAMPMIKGILSLVKAILVPIVKLLDPLLKLVAAIMEPIVKLLEPIFGFVGALAEALANILEPILDLLTPLIEILTLALQPIFDILGFIFDLLSPIFDAIGEASKIVSDIAEGPLALLSGALDGIKVVLNFVYEAFSKVFGGIKNVVGGAWDFLSGIIGKITGGFGGLVEKITGGIKSFADGVGNVVSTAVDGIKGFFGSAVEGIKNFFGFGGDDTSFEDMLREAREFQREAEREAAAKKEEELYAKGESARNVYEDYIAEHGSLPKDEDIDDILRRRKGKIPRLASGTVIPPNRQFLAMLGDQRSGTNIEAPLETIKQALAEVLLGSGGMSHDPIVLALDGRTVAEVVWDESEKRYKQTGKIGAY